MAAFGFIPLCVNALAVVLAWAGMGTPWFSICVGGSNGICGEFKLFGEGVGKGNSEVMASQAFAVLSMLCLVACLISGIIHVFTDINKQGSALAAIILSFVAALCAIISLGIASKQLMERGQGAIDIDITVGVSSGAALYVLCVLLAVALAVLWIVTKRKDAAST